MALNAARIHAGFPVLQIWKPVTQKKMEGGHPHRASSDSLWNHTSSEVQRMLKNNGVMDYDSSAEVFRSQYLFPHANTL
jgi:hypothetical protein